MSAAFMPRLALPYAPHWLIPTPWPHPPPSAVAVSPDDDREKRGDGKGSGTPGGVAMPPPLALETKSPTAIDWSLNVGGGGWVVGGAVGGGCVGAGCPGRGGA